MDLVPLLHVQNIVMASELSDEELRRRYLDWCSTQVARRFLELSLDDVWLRSHVAAALPDDAPPGSFDPAASHLTAGRIPGYLELVRKTTLMLAQEMDLPAFDDWKQKYESDPSSFADDILGR